MTLSKLAAVAAYDAACAVPASANWRAVADMLRAALPGAKAVSDGPAWWADYALPKAYATDSVDVLFHDGETVRANVFTARNKPPRVAATIRTAIAFYRARTGAETVPPIASVTRVSDGAAFDAETCSALTAALRSKDGARIEAQGARAITSDSIARMTAELERRRGGLAIAETAFSPLASAYAALSENERYAIVHQFREAESRVAMWQAAVTGGEEELARMHAAYGAIEAAPAVVTEPIPMPAEALALDDIAAALALPYGEPAALDYSGTFDADSSPLDTAPDSSGANVLPVALDDAGTAPPELGRAAEPIEAIAEPWRPSAQTHPIVALCLSDKAREALEARVLDGTWRAAGRDAAGGAWRLTLDDARACADIPSLRLVGMPRKPRRPRVAPPIEAIAACPPLEKIAAIPAAYMVPGAGRPAGAVTFHSAPTA